MGILQFFKIIIKNPTSTNNDKTLESLAREITLPKMKGLTICIDASNIIYSSILALKATDTLTDSEGRTTAHINTIWNKVMQINAAGVRQIWVFDSPQPNPIKAAELARRRERAAASSDSKVQFRMSGDHVADIKKLFDCMGVAYVEAPPGVEAEHYGAWMTRGSAIGNRFCAYMLSGDSDVLAFGGNLLRQVSKPSATGKSSKTVFHIYEKNELLEEIGLSNEQFLQMCVAMGTDFNEKSPRVGPKTIMSAIRKGITMTPEQQKIIEYYSSEPQGQAQSQFPTYNIENLVEYLVSRGFKEDRVRTRLTKYKIIA